MAFQVGSICYASAEAAASASASTQIGQVITLGDDPYVVGVSTVSSDSITYSLEPFISGPVLYRTVMYDAQPCQLIGMDDSLLLAWGIAAAWLAAYAVIYLKNALFGAGSSDRYYT